MDFHRFFCSTKIYFTVAQQQQQQTNGRKTFAPEINFLVLFSAFSKKEDGGIVISLLRVFVGIMGKRFVSYFAEINCNSPERQSKFRKFRIFVRNLVLYFTRASFSQFLNFHMKDKKTTAVFSEK
jgi:hypothetical protein